MHLGHAYAAWEAHAWGGLRIEDIFDHAVCCDAFAEAIPEDFDWLRISYHAEITDQQSRVPDYRAALESLVADELVYPCLCSRTDIRRAQVARAPHGCGVRYLQEIVAGFQARKRRIKSLKARCSPIASILLRRKNGSVGYNFTIIVLEFVIQILPN
ncbi:MAG: hypothetical protein HRT36_01160 [Alphaproteobacteria bacterium]|nr:hypothetical protein [Alphaproteobacteria bacterium]